MKTSLRRINQLGYFKSVEASADNPKVEKVPGEKNKVDVTMKFEEQNRNQLTFGAGVSQFEGFFGQLAFQTSNFLGRGESATFWSWPASSRRTTSSPSANRSSSTGRSPRDSTCSNANCGTGTRTRRNRRAST